MHDELLNEAWFCDVAKINTLGQLREFIELASTVTSTSHSGHHLLELELQRRIFGRLGLSGAIPWLSPEVLERQNLEGACRAKVQAFLLAGPQQDPNG